MIRQETKKVMAILVAIVMLLSMLPVNVIAHSTIASGISTKISTESHDTDECAQCVDYDDTYYDDLYDKDEFDEYDESDKCEYAYECICEYDCENEYEYAYEKGRYLP